MNADPETNAFSSTILSKQPALSYIPDIIFYLIVRKPGPKISFVIFDLSAGSPNLSLF